MDHPVGNKVMIYAKWFTVYSLRFSVRIPILGITAKTQREQSIKIFFSFFMPFAPLRFNSLFLFPRALRGSINLDPNRPVGAASVAIPSQRCVLPHPRPHFFLASLTALWYALAMKGAAARAARRLYRD
jgi:hypothetical protein